jgi:hypothetical protein
MDIKVDFGKDKLLSKESLLLQSLYTYYQEDDNIERIIPIVTGKAQVSLRVLDWFVTNYSKKYDVNFMIKKNREFIKFNVYQDYKNKLKSYNKRFFDPFCRQNKKNLTNKIAFKYNEDKYIVTTIGQLNFFRWAIRNNVINYVEEHLDLINNHMNRNNYNKKKYKIKNTNIKKKKVQRYKINTTIDFGSKVTNNLSLKLNAMGIEDSKYKITKLDFSN